MITTVIGTRPEIIKMSELIPLLDKSFKHDLVFTNQHYSPEMCKIFFDELGVREPDAYLHINSPDYVALYRSIFARLKETKPDYVISYADVNTALAAALAAFKLGIKVIHLEAGLRSFDSEMPEELNRYVADRYSDLLLTPTELTRRFLEREGLTKGVHVVGNTVVDACLKYSKLAEKKSTLKDLGLEKDGYVLVTAHRQETVDRKERLADLLKGLSMIDRDILYPMHPRTQKRIQEFGLEVPRNVRVIEPLGYFDFLNLMKNCSLLMTDSGGAQEEAITLKVPCLTMRRSTERWETIIAGGNFLVGTRPELISYYARMVLDSELKDRMKKTVNPYGNGDASRKTVKAMEENCR